MRDKWDERWLGLASHYASWSKDPSTQVGAVIVTYDNAQLSQGYNGFARGVEYNDERLERPTKYTYMVHAEHNCITTAARLGRCLSGSTLFLAGASFVCSGCANSIVQAGIRELVVDQAAPKPKGEHYEEDFKHAKFILDSGSVWARYA